MELRHANVECSWVMTKPLSNMIRQHFVGESGFKNLARSGVDFTELHKSIAESILLQNIGLLIGNVKQKQTGNIVFRQKFLKSAKCQYFNRNFRYYVWEVTSTFSSESPGPKLISFHPFKDARKRIRRQNSSLPNAIRTPCETRNTPDQSVAQLLRQIRAFAPWRTAVYAPECRLYRSSGVPVDESADGDEWSNATTAPAKKRSEQKQATIMVNVPRICLVHQLVMWLQLYSFQSDTWVNVHSLCYLDRLQHTCLLYTSPSPRDA